MPDPKKNQTAILLVDDHVLFRESVGRLLGAESGFRVVGNCSSIEEGLDVLRKVSVDVILLDFDLGRHDGIEFMQVAKQQGFTGKVLVVTAGVKKDQAADFIRLGASGIFMKHNSAELLIEGIQDVLAGKVWFNQNLLQEVVHSVADQPEPKANHLTKREEDVLSYIFEGLGNKEIANKVGISESSVKATLQRLFSKMGVRTRSQLVRVALQRRRG